MKNVIAIIQSSWKSDQLEYKSLVKLSNDKTVLEMIVESLRKIDAVSKIILTTSDHENEAPLLDEAKRLQIESFQGPQHKVLNRLKLAAEKFPGTILKIDGHKPLFDPIDAAELIEEHFKDNYDYSFNGHYDGVIYGADCEIFNSTVFEKINFSLLTDEQLESGTLNLRYLSQDFKINAKQHVSPRHHYRVVLETQKDLEVINSILSHIDDPSQDNIAAVLDEYEIIAAYNTIEPKREVGLNKIMLFPDKIKAIQEVEIDKPDSTYPISVELSLTMRCNFDCVWCSDKDLRARQEDDFDIVKLTELAKDLAANGTKGVVIEGGGEPTIVPHFDEAVEAFRSEGLGVGLITNGSKKMKKDVIEKFDWIRVSLDASNHEEMLRLKKYKNFDKVISNIIHYSKHCKLVGVGYVATNENLAQIETLILRLRDSGVHYIQIRPVVDHPELKPDYDFEYLKKYQTISFSVITDGMKENIIRGNGNVACNSHSLSTVITADGSVYFCGRLNIHDWIKPVGNVNETSFYDIWNGEERKKQSNMVLDKDFCSLHCPECRITKFNLEFNKLAKIETTNFI